MELKKAIYVIFDVFVFACTSMVYIIEAFLLLIVPRRYKCKSIQGEVALITGGAGGIGKLIAIKLAALGAHVVIWDINESGIQDVIDEIRSMKGKCSGYVCDISDKNEVYRVAKTVQIEIGNVTIVINNAGYIYGKTFMDIPDVEIEKTFKVNILSHYWINKSFLKEMMKDNHGHIVTIASIAGMLGTYNCTDYSATKFAAIGYHESLFTELNVHGYHGINMTLVCPYVINTGMFPNVTPRLIPALEPEYVAEEIVFGILTNKINVTLPGSANYMLPLKNILPAKLWWAFIHDVVKSPQAMMMLKKHDESDGKKFLFDD
ncbi:estradiol 17-beta-dehydrogenase 11-like, partial [Aphidius gifuensis]